ncbi:hypothetical protein R4282_06685 [Rhodococcus oxybenzonivorans]|uniref:hypothetical protein n=1 Tax=Rhodococcus oxybenzonivorans TaxID=1990687 RepID=UPI00295485F7|nr:hypothetical protein [Rhodococcus oxybenzonivorans]MDV7352702.1 hypothetical protein [Rhodococcus oxybenzonivorans]
MMFGTGVILMVALLGVALVVVPVSFGVAARADAKVRALAESRASDPDPVGSVAVADADEQCDRWRQLATRAWLICGGASLVAVAVVGVLICVG